MGHDTGAQAAPDGNPIGPQRRRGTRVHRTRPALQGCGRRGVRADRGGRHWWARSCVESQQLRDAGRQRAHPLAVGAEVEFKFQLDDGVVALSGRAEVVRIVSDPVGMGLRFVSLDGSGRELVDRLVEAGVGAPEVPTAPGYAAAAVEFEHGSVRVRLSAATAVYFTYNPLLHIGVGGCFLPAESDVPLGTGYQVDILDPRDQLLVRCRAKVAAKQDRWVGLRFIGIDRATLQLLRAEIAKLSTTNTP